MRNQDGEMNSVPGYSLTGAGSGRVGDGETSEALGWLGHGDCPTGPRQGKGGGWPSVLIRVSGWVLAHGQGE
jgi:hypothetical protein